MKNFLIIDKVRMVMESTYITNDTILDISKYLYEKELGVIDFHEKIQGCINVLTTSKTLVLDSLGTLYYENGMTYFHIDPCFYVNNKLPVKAKELISSNYVLLLMFNYCYKNGEPLPNSIYNTLGRININCNLPSLKWDLSLAVSCFGMKVLNDNIEVL